MKKVVAVALPVLLVATLLTTYPATAQHEAENTINAQQGIVAHADATVATTPVAMLTPNAERVNAICGDTGSTNAARLGGSPSDVGASTGIYLAPAPALPIKLETTQFVYAYSASGTTVNCGEIVRGPGDTPTPTPSPVPTQTPVPSPTPEP